MNGGRLNRCTKLLDEPLCPLFDQIKQYVPFDGHYIVPEKPSEGAKEVLNKCDNCRTFQERPNGLPIPDQSRVWHTPGPEIKTAQFGVEKKKEDYRDAGVDLKY